jgi:uncharacterized membrane protein
MRQMLTDDFMLAIASEAARWFELAGIAAIIVGAAIAFGGLALRLFGLRQGSESTAPYEHVPAFRKALGRSILVSLELLVAADIIRTVAIEPTMHNVLVLGVIVLIRTFLSISLEIEIDGKWPWQRAADR